MRNIGEIKDELDAAKERRDRVREDLDKLDGEAGGEALRGGKAERFDNLRAGFRKAESDVETLDSEWQSAMLTYVRDNPGIRLEPGGPPAEPTRDEGDPRTRGDRDAGLRAIDRHRDALSPDAGDRLERSIRERDERGVGARYLAAVGDPNYDSAFGKMVIDPTTGHLRFSAQEVEAVRKVSAVMAERALAVGSDAAGGFAVPFTLDPTILLSSSGALNPVRDLARVVQITTDKWKGVSSDGVTAAYAAEATEATDNSPVLAQPVADTAKGQAFVPFSIEIGQDWNSLQTELAGLLSDGRDVVDATQMLTGTGTNAPKGLLTGLTTTQRVQTTGAGTYAIGDVYKLKQALPARFISRAAFAMNPNIIDTTYRFVGGNSAEPPVVTADRASVLGYPAREWSTMVSTTTTTSKIAIFGDFSNYLIADRIGATIELVPHLFGATNRFPTGQRGLYFYWRTGTEVLVPNAFRYLEVL